MTITISRRIIVPLLTLLLGFTLGFTGVLPGYAEDPSPVAQGEILKVCINLKNGAIRVSNKCDTKTERKTVLGGVGGQGPQGVKGDTGVTGAAGSVSGLNTSLIRFYSPAENSNGCPMDSWYFTKRVVESSELITTESYVFGQGFLRSVTGLRSRTTNLNPCQIIVYTP